jgi:hypothetical protein
MHACGGVRAEHERAASLERYHCATLGGLKIRDVAKRDRGRASRDRLSIERDLTLASDEPRTRRQLLRRQGERCAKDCE